MAEDTRPLCECHGEPMLKNGVERRHSVPTQAWTCSIKRRENSQRTFNSLEHVAWNKRLLQMRAAHRRWANRKKREALG